VLPLEEGGGLCLFEEGEGGLCFCLRRGRVDCVSEELGGGWIVSA